MVNAVFWLAMAVAAMGAYAGNRTACALLISACVCLALDAAEVPFELVLWMIIDGMVIAWMLSRPSIPRRDFLILALFPQAWGFYLMGDPWRYIGTSLVASLQMFLTFPARKTPEMRD